ANCFVFLEYLQTQALKVMFLNLNQKYSIGNCFYYSVRDLSSDYVPASRAFYFYNYHDIFPTTKITIEAADFREWEVTFGRSADGKKYFLHGGWVNVLRDLRLRHQMVVVFKLVCCSRYEIVAYHRDGSVVDFNELQSVANAATPSHSLPASTSVSVADIFSNKSKGEKGQDQFYLKAKIQKRMQITNALAKASGLKPGMSLNIKFDDQAPVKAEVGTEKNGRYKK
ncbi:hypothetical protein M8C21_002689, partial [Ambrosia artemisiifolia]